MALTAAPAEGAIVGSDARGGVREGPRVLSPASARVGRLIPDLEFAPVEGSRFRLAERQPKLATVIAFTSTSCPITKRYAPSLAALEKEMAARGVQFIYVNPIETDPDADIAEARRTHGFKAPYARDPGGRIQVALGARSTAEVFVLDAARTLVYRGAIDDQYGLGYSKNEPRQRYLVDAIDALAAARVPEIRATTAPGCALELRDESAVAKSPVTYHNRVSRIVQDNCAGCHHAGGIAPFSLETPADLASHAGMIRKVVDNGTMPPWFADPSVDTGTNAVVATRWSNDRRLNPDDKKALLDWLAGDRAPGNPADAPIARAYPKDWEIGKPEAVFEIPQPIEVKATGRMPYQEVTVETGFAEDRWVQELEVRPTAREVVHHVLVFVDPPDPRGTNAPARRRRGEGGVGNFFAVYVPGNNVLRYPEGLAKHLPAGASLRFQIHYTPKGTATRDQTRLGLKFARKTPEHEVRVAAIAPLQLVIPAGAANHEVRAALPVPFNARVLSFMPHMHLRGKAYRYELEDSQGRRSMLLDVPHYDFNWQLQYQLAEPLEVSAGSRLHGTAWFDNSAGNPANPDPGRDVKWGIQTEDEMALGYLEFIVPGIPPGTPVPSARSSSTRGGGGGGGALFAVLDRNGDGVITREEAPDPVSFEKADADHDGKVTREELRDLIRKQRNR